MSDKTWYTTGGEHSNDEIAMRQQKNSKKATILKQLFRVLLHPLLIIIDGGSPRETTLARTETEVRGIEVLCRRFVQGFRSRPGEDLIDGRLLVEDSTYLRPDRSSRIKTRRDLNDLGANSVDLVDTTTME